MERSKEPEKSCAVPTRNARLCTPRAPQRSQARSGGRAGPGRADRGAGAEQEPHRSSEKQCQNGREGRGRQSDEKRVRGTDKQMVIQRFCRWANESEAFDYNSLSDA